MKRLFFLIGIIFGGLLVFCQFSCAENLSLGFGYPYVSAKYNLSEKTSIEARYATGSGINVYAGRFYWSFKKYDKLNVFTGFEGGYVSFNTLDMKGTGYETSVFLGGEHFISKRTSFILDFAPTLIGLKSDDYKVSGIEWVLNLGLYIYFAGNKTADNLMRKENIIQNTVIESPLEKAKEEESDADINMTENQENSKDTVPDKTIQKSKSVKIIENDGLLDIELPD